MDGPLGAEHLSDWSGSDVDHNATGDGLSKDNGPISTGLLVATVFGSVTVTFGLVFGTLFGIKTCVKLRMSRTQILSMLSGVFLLALLAFTGCLVTNLMVTDDEELDFVTLMFCIQFAAFLLLPVIIIGSGVMTRYLRTGLSSYDVSCCDTCFTAVRAEEDRVRQFYAGNPQHRESYISVQDFFNRVLLPSREPAPNYDEAMRRSRAMADDRPPSYPESVASSSHDNSRSDNTNCAPSTVASVAANLAPPVYDEALQDEVVEGGGVENPAYQEEERRGDNE